MKKNNNLGIFIKLTEEENAIVKKMKKQYCINMSQFVRNAIREFYDKLEKANGS